MTRLENILLGGVIVNLWAWLIMLYVHLSHYPRQQKQILDRWDRSYDLQILERTHYLDATSAYEKGRRKGMRDALEGKDEA